MIDGLMARKPFGGALSLAADVARHVAWFVSHQIERRPRDR